MGTKKTNMRELEATAKLSATAKVINTLNRPGQLEKIDQIKQRYVRKKASVEAQLKSAMQQQLDGVRIGLNQLHRCLEDVAEINSCVKKMCDFFADVPDLCKNLNDVRDENMKHSQYVTAKENLKHIFTVPESVEKTKAWINEGKLLHTHQCLRDLENSRDDLLFELHKLPNQSVHDKSMLKAYFADVEVLSNLLEKQLTFVLSRTLNTVRKDPTVIVTALRIIEREEKADEEALKQQKQTGFIPPGRPKKWKEMAFRIFEKSVSSKIEGTQVEEREDNKHWLIRYLELIRMMILEDLRVVKTLCLPCFPPSYKILDKYIHMYHSGLSVHLQEIIQNGLKGNEYVTMLSWVLKTYKSTDMLGHPDLAVYTENLSPLLPQAVLDRLEGDYLKNIESNYMEWMQNTLKSEKEEWKSQTEPHLESYSRTAAPIIIFQMIDQNLQVAKTISEDLTIKSLNLSIQQVISFADPFKEAIIEFKNKYFEDRKQLVYFTQYMIVIVNNCLQLVELGSQLEKQYVKTNTSHELSRSFGLLKTTYIKLRNEAVQYLLEEPLVDLDQHFEKLFTSQWLTLNPTDTIYVTIEDYFQDYNRLVEANYKYVVEQVVSIVGRRYLTAMLSRRISFKTYDECVKAAQKVAEEARRFNQLFTTLCSDLECENPFEAIIMLSEVLKSDDDMLSFELHRVVEKFPDITDDHLLRLLSLRGDLSRSDVREKVAHVDKPNVLHKSSVFKTLVFPKLVNINLNF
ncbi:exocyst complex component 3 isoform X1 [Diorhabda sublineata]|uniref:exocyst complex component 3 isoform X1 n=2 Tax=Diorhabda sublineata TaxID=1163346 RepID=UPI0024E0A503|nr:exocyst complex component 3 isoform X1 [Diorhabda sublineata]